MGDVIRHMLPVLLRLENKEGVKKFRDFGFETSFVSIKGMTSRRAFVGNIDVEGKVNV